MGRQLALTGALPQRGDVCEPLQLPLFFGAA
jgi:hypothetical protein